MRVVYGGDGVPAERMPSLQRACNSMLALVLCKYASYVEVDDIACLLWLDGVCGSYGVSIPCVDALQRRLPLCCTRSLQWCQPGACLRFTVTNIVRTLSFDCYCLSQCS